MNGKFIRLLIAAAFILGIVLLAGGQEVWAGTQSASEAVAVLEQGDSSIPLSQSEPGSVKPPPPEFSVCADGRYSVGGVVILAIKDLKPGYCIKALLWDPYYQTNLIPEGAGKPLAHMLYLRVFFEGSLVYDVPAADGVLESCYAIPPEKQAQVYIYDYYGVRFEKRTEPPQTWNLLQTRVDDNNKVACAFTQTSGVYALVGK